MKKFFLRLSLFMLPIILISYPADKYISDTIRKSNSFAGWEYPTMNAIMDGKIDSEIIIHGSSRAWIDVDATLLGSAFGTHAYNLGIDGHNFYLEYLRHQLLLDYNQKPKLIIQILDNHSLAKVPELTNPDQFLPYMLWNSKICKAINTYEGFNYYDCIFPLIRYYGKLDALKEFKKLQKNPSENPVKRIRGSYGFDLQWNATEFESLKKNLEKQHKTTFNTNLDTASVKLFDAYLKDCRSKNIRVVMVYAPDFIEGQKVMGNRKEIMDLYTHFSKKYALTYYDYSNDSISYQKKYFYNVMHLNKTGAKYFTTDLIAKLKNDKAVQTALRSKM